MKQGNLSCFPAGVPASIVTTPFRILKYTRIFLKMILGLTGSFGSGKSTVAGMFHTLAEAHVIDADKITHDLQQPGMPALAGIAAEFGDGVVAADGSLDRAKLAKIVFSSAAELEKLNDIIHPLVYAEIGRQIKNLANSDLVVLMVPLLFETGGDALCDKVAVVTVTEEQRIKRLMERDGLTEEQIRRRLKAQTPQSVKAGRADFVIDNSGSPAETLSQVKAVLKQLGLATAAQPS